MAAMAKAQESTNTGLAMAMKSILELLMRCIIGNEVRRLRSSMKLKINRVTTSEVNKLAATPMVRVTPKPLIGPVPR